MARGQGVQLDAFSVTVIAAEVLFLFLYGFCVEYPDTTVGGNASNATVAPFYGSFQDVHVMTFVGFGFLMTYMRKYGYSAVGLNFFLAAFVIQWAILSNGFWANVFNDNWDKIQLDITSLITGDFAAAAVLISFGAVAGKATPLQLLLMAIVEIFFYSINTGIGGIELQAVDFGGSMFVHTFGAFFGLGVSFMLAKPEEVRSRAGDEPQASKSSDMTAMIGTLFLWIFWPSFNGALAAGAGNSQHRVIINTVLALTASCIATFALGKLLRNGKFEMEDIQNATLAGGVAMGSAAGVVAEPWGAILIGFIAGIVASLGFRYGTQALSSIGVHDSRGVNNLHGMPGILGAIAGAISAGVADSTLYGDNVGLVFPKRADGRTAAGQAAVQLYVMLITLGISIFGGLLTGFALSFLNQSSSGSFYDDEENWVMPEDEQPIARNVRMERMGGSRRDVRDRDRDMDDRRGRGEARV